MPLRNRVTPFGEIVAVPGRGTLMGNRGVLHAPDGRIVRDSQVRRWIACELEFRGRHRELLQPGRWTELFFLDEAAAMAAGHRPCAECRNRDYKRFLDLWHAVYPDRTWGADAIDHRLHAERRLGPWHKRTYSAPLADLPDGTYIALPDGTAHVVLGEWLLAWSPERYTARTRRPVDVTVTVLTPESLVRVLRAGYAPRLHTSVANTVIV